MDDDLRVRVAEAIGKTLAEFAAHKWDGLAAESDSVQGMLIAAAEVAIAERDRTVRFEVPPGCISDSDLRCVLRFHREAVDIEWGAGAHIAGVTFVETINLSNFDPLNEVVTEFRAGATYWTGDGPRATPVAGAHPMMAGIHELPVPDAA